MIFRLAAALLLGLCSSAIASPYLLQCEAIGYAYSYDNKQFYESQKARFIHQKSNSCGETGSAHAKNEWNSYFSSMVPESFKYTVGVHSACECHGKAPSGVTRRHQDFRSDFVNKGFQLYRLDEFDPDDRTY